VPKVRLEGLTEPQETPDGALGGERDMVPMSPLIPVNVIVLFVWLPTATVAG
jgi:hypothetical protein